MSFFSLFLWVGAMKEKIFSSDGREGSEELIFLPFCPRGLARIFHMPCRVMKFSVLIRDLNQWFLQRMFATNDDDGGYDILLRILILLRNVFFFLFVGKHCKQIGKCDLGLWLLGDWFFGNIICVTFWTDCDKLVMVLKF